MFAESASVITGLTPRKKLVAPSASVTIFHVKDTKERFVEVRNYVFSLQTGTIQNFLHFVCHKKF